MFMLVRAALTGAALATLAVPAAAQERLTVTQAVAGALEGNPDLRAFAAEIDAAQARLGGANLAFQFNPEFVGGVGPRFNPQLPSSPVLDIRADLTQQLEIFGQPGYRRAAAEAALRSAEEQFQARRVELGAQVGTAYAQATAARAQRELADGALQLATEAFEAVQSREQAGAASVLEVNSARVELGRAAREQVVAIREEASADATLRLLVGLPPAMPLVLVPLEPTDPAALPRVEALVAEALDKRGDVRAADAALRAAREQVGLADALGRPNLRVGASYGREDGAADIFLANVGLALPVFNRNVAGRGEAAAAVIQAEQAQIAVRRRAEQEVRFAVQRFEAARSATEVFAVAVTRALEESLAMSLEAYRAGKLDFFQLLLIRREALEGRRGRIDAQRELNAARAELDRSLGRLP